MKQSTKNSTTCKVRQAARLLGEEHTGLCSATKGLQQQKHQAGCDGLRRRMMAKANSGKRPQSTANDGKRPQMTTNDRK